MIRLIWLLKAAVGNWRRRGCSGASLYRVDVTSGWQATIQTTTVLTMTVLTTTVLTTTVLKQGVLCYASTCRAAVGPWLPRREHGHGCCVSPVVRGITRRSTVFHDQSTTDRNATLQKSRGTADLAMWP